MSTHVPASAVPLLAVLAIAVIAARAVYLRVRAIVRAVARTARWFGWGAAFGAAAVASGPHLAAVLALAAVAALAVRALMPPAAARSAS